VCVQIDCSLQIVLLYATVLADKLKRAYACALPGFSRAQGVHRTPSCAQRRTIISTPGTSVSQPSMPNRFDAGYLR